MTRGTRSFFPAIAAFLMVVAGLCATTTPASAVAYAGYSDWRTISANGTQTCAIRTTGYLYCWNTDGTGSAGIPLSGYRDWKSVSVGASHRCAIRSTGLLYCWGSDTYGQVGNGSLGSPSSPVRIGGATDWKTVSAGEKHTCGIRGSGLLACWGSDENGQLGNGEPASGYASVPIRVGTAVGWKAVTTGGAHACAIWGNNTLYCWGSDAAGQVGNGGSAASTPVTSPTRISAASWLAVNAGGNHSCAIRSDGLLGCWGSDSNGQLGNGDLGDRTAPVRTTNVTDWKRLSTGTNHTCAYRGTGTLYCWGKNDARQSVETSSSESFQTPQRYVGIYDWRTIAAGDRHTCAIRATGRIYCWGDQKAPSTGTPAGTKPPAQVLDLRRWKITIPVDGSDAGTAADEVKWPELGTYLSLSHFHANLDNTAVVFRSPVGGAKTGGSVFARSELRERTLWTGSGQKNCDWTNQSGTHVMEIRQAVTHLPPKVPRVVVGQIHDPSDEVVMVRVDGSTISAEASYPDPGYPDGRKVNRVMATGYKLGTPFTIKITANPNGVFVAYNGVTKASFLDRVSTGAATDGWYFKAGLYLQTNTDKGEAATEYGEAVISNLTLSHSNGACG